VGPATLAPDTSTSVFRGPIGRLLPVGAPSPGALP
jgi:hypothetical protein